MKICSGEILCFLDDDVELNPTYLKNLHQLFSEHENVCLATGPCLPAYEITPPDWLSYLWTTNEYGKHCGWLSLLDFGIVNKQIHPNFVWGLNFCIRKKTLLELGGFHPDYMPQHLQKYQGDGETGLTLKAAANAYEATYSPQLALKHYVPKERLSPEYLKKRAFFQGICESFTQLRKEYLSVSVVNKHYRKGIRDHLHPYYKWVKVFLHQKRDQAPPEIRTLLKMLHEIERSGYDFHQQQFYNDNKIRGWVLKDNYWDYNLPQ
ncbi:hypothetical protein D9M68_519620 [compost metagenome]